MSNFIINPYAFSGLLLDRYTGAAAAYSVRKLSNTYTGSVLRVRRSSDNTEQDIGFDSSGNLDESSLLSFVGYQNLLIRSEEFNDAIWTKSNSTVTANQTTDPLGGSTADFLRQNSGTDGAISQGTFSFTSGTAYTHSCYAKKENYTYLLLALPSSAFPSTSRIALFNLNDGTVASATHSGVTTAISSVGNGWYRCSVTQTANATASATVAIASRGSNVLAGTGNGTDGIYVWGAQLNTGSSPATYQQTTSAAWTSLDGYVTKWYDQSGNTRDASQTTSANQPRIVNAGAVEKTNNKVSIRFDGSDDRFRFTNSKSMFKNSGYAQAFSVSAPSNTTNEDRWIFLHSIGSGIGSRFLMGKQSAANGIVAGGRRLDGDSFASSGAITHFSGQKLVTGFLQYASSDAYIYTNGILGSSNLSFQTDGNTSNTDAYVEGSIGANNDIDGLASGYWLGTQQELIFYASDQSSSRSAIETDINNYFSIY